VIERRVLYIVHATETAWLKIQETVLKPTYLSVCKGKKTCLQVPTAVCRPKFEDLHLAGCVQKMLEQISGVRLHTKTRKNLISIYDVRKSLAFLVKAPTFACTLSLDFYL
jgi:hypothetical protein